jgi:hypothetical protein
MRRCMWTLFIIILFIWSWRIEDALFDFLVSRYRIVTYLNVVGFVVGISFLIFWDTNLVGHMILQRELNSELGFWYDAPRNEGDDVLVITEMEPGKLMEKSGLRVGDRVRYSRRTDLYSMFLLNQGKEVTLPISRNGKPVVLLIHVPIIRTFVDPHKIWWGLQLKND